MTTKREQAAKQQRESFIKGQTNSIQLATKLTDNLSENIQKSSPGMIAHYLAEAMQQRAWEGVVAYNNIGDLTVKKYANPLEWIRAHFFMEPDEVMRIVASPLPTAEDGAAAAIELINAVKAYEPSSFAVLMDKQNPRNWKELLHANERREGGPWISAARELDSPASIQIGRKQSVSTLLHAKQAKELNEELRSVAAVAKQMNVTSTQVEYWLSISDTCTTDEHIEMVKTINAVESTTFSRGSSSNRSSIHRRLTRYSQNSRLCASHNTTQEKVKQGLAAFLSGASGQESLRIAGLRTHSRKNGGLGVDGPANDVARRLIKRLQPSGARAIAEEIIKQLES